jgi:hypothetical protein
MSEQPTNDADVAAAEQILATWRRHPSADLDLLNHRPHAPAVRYWRSIPKEPPMIPHLRYLSYLLRHKWYVLRAGVVLGVPLWQLLIHDWTKFTPVEWGPYVRHFYGSTAKPLDIGQGYMHERGDDSAFDAAWEHHWRHNPHHWQYWSASGDGTPPAPIPEAYTCEMVADWYGAGRAQGNPDVSAWYNANGKKMLLHDDTRALVERLIGDAKRLKLIP